MRFHTQQELEARFIAVGVKALQEGRPPRGAIIHDALDIGLRIRFQDLVHYAAQAAQATN